MGEANSNTILQLGVVAFGRVDTDSGIDNKDAQFSPLRSVSVRHGLPMIRIDDILAALILSLFMFRRLEVLTIQVEDNPHLDPEKLASWKTFTLTGYAVGAIACGAKVVLSLGWFWFFKTQPLALMIGGLTIFAGWVVALMWTWRRSTEANAVRAELQIQRRPPPPKVR